MLYVDAIANLICSTEKLHLYLSNAILNLSNKTAFGLACTNAIKATSARHRSKMCEAKNNHASQGCHAQINHFEFQSDTLTSNMLINLYSKCNLVDYSKKIVR